MNRLGIKFCVALFVTVSLMWGQGLAKAAAADLYTFQPPAGWQDLTNAKLGDRAVSIWRGPTDTNFGENILLLVRPTSLTLDEASDVKAIVKAIEPTLTGAQASRQRMTICGGHQAMYVYVTAPVRGQTLISETVVSVWDKLVYTATYSRLAYQETVQSARSALTTLCPPAASSSSTSW